MTRLTFEKGMALLAKSFPNKDKDFDVYWAFLKDLDDRSFLNAIIKIIKTNKDINTATNLVALIRDNAISSNITAGEAWAKVLKQVKEVGSYGNPRFNDTIIQKSVDCIGWKNICLSENISFERAHFFKVYDSLSLRERNDRLAMPETTNKLISEIAVKIGVGGNDC